MNIQQYLDKNNLHHAYLIEGTREKTVNEILEFIRSLGIETNANADVCRIELDSFKIDDARNLKSLASEKSFSAGRRMFIVSANSFLPEAQNSLLKMFEEPVENTHFFIITPDANNFLKTLVSRFYFIPSDSDLAEELKEAEKFIRMPLKSRIDFIKELLTEEEETDEEGNEIISLHSSRSKSLKFLNALETILHKKFVKNSSDSTYFSHFFKVREFLRMPGSSVKSLMESVALVTPENSY